ncbi:receptor-transporting protein 3-like [Pyxicephalus adspersus]|uniref:receptor-transporting protein 3-like n=1 Tax=Pyxicephalus adspersus TaxID=30357 RepID=UPI003B5CA077
MNEMKWKSEFANQIHKSEFPDQWNLCVDMDLSKQERGLYYSQHTFASFRCSFCPRSWNSSKVYVLFLLNLRNHGTVRMRIFRQDCERCQQGFLEEPEITPENIKNAVYNLIHKIQKTFYEPNDSTQEQKAKTYGILDGPHNREHCEGCRLGFCENEGNPMQNSAQGSFAPVLWGALAVGAVGAIALCSAFASNNKKESKK